MNSFESIIANLLELDGFWVRTSYKVELSKDDKAKIGRATSPRWELDVVAYNPRKNLLKVVECKSYLDSRGVSFKGLNPATGGTPRFKLFNEPKTRTVVLKQLEEQLFAIGSIRPKAKTQLCLAAGNIVARDEERIRDLFKSQKWELLDREWIVERLKKLGERGYENSAASITAKLLRQDEKGIA
jgi:hypothetical protein